MSRLSKYLDKYKWMNCLFCRKRFMYEAKETGRKFCTRSCARKNTGRKEDGIQK